MECIEIKYRCCSLTQEDVISLQSPQYSDQEIIKLFKALGHKLRLNILRILLVEKQICTCELTELFGENQPIITKQLTLLKDKFELIVNKKITFSTDGKVEQKESGKWTAYSIMPNKREQLEYLLKPFIKAG
ncbi:MAG: hypothetical protein ACFFDT_17365 [Candidatus Hodarchaeota archaeon]